jgi:hypothetical protein
MIGTRPGETLVPVGGGFEPRRELLEMVDANAKQNLKKRGRCGLCGKKRWDIGPGPSFMNPGAHAAVGKLQVRATGRTAQRSRRNMANARSTIRRAKSVWRKKRAVFHASTNLHDA